MRMESAWVVNRNLVTGTIRSSALLDLAMNCLVVIFAQHCSSLGLKTRPDLRVHTLVRSLGTNFDTKAAGS